MKSAIASAAAFFLVLIAYPLAARGQDGGIASAPAAVVNGEPILAGELLDALLSQNGQDVLNGLIRRKLMDQKMKEDPKLVTGEETEKEMKWLVKVVGQQRGQPVTPQELDEMVRQNAGVPAAEYLRYLLFFRKVLKIDDSDEALKSFYTAKGRAYGAPEQYRASHVLLRAIDPATKAVDWKASMAKAEEVRKALDAGGDFGELAKKYSECPSKEKGGDLGFFERGKMLPEFEAAVVAIEDGQVSAPVRTAVGYHIIKRTGYKKAETPEFDSIKDLVRHDYLMWSVQTKSETWFAGETAKAKIEYNLNGLRETLRQTAGRGKEQPK